jgi:hypothetical protein
MGCDTGVYPAFLQTLPQISVLKIRLIFPVFKTPHTIAFGFKSHLVFRI